jgi:septin family protein
MGIEDCRLKIEYLWSAVNLKKTEHSDSLNLQSSIFNFFLSGLRKFNGDHIPAFPRDWNGLVIEC